MAKRGLLDPVLPPLGRSADITKWRHGWLRPDGKFFPCAREEHLNLLDRLGVHYTAADKLGWCKVATNGAGEPLLFLHKGVATQAQINAIDRHCAAFGIELPRWAGGKGI